MANGLHFAHPEPCSHQLTAERGDAAPSHHSAHQTHKPTTGTLLGDGGYFFGPWYCCHQLRDGLGRDFLSEEGENDAEAFFGLRSIDTGCGGKAGDEFVHVRDSRDDGAAIAQVGSARDP